MKRKIPRSTWLPCLLLIYLAVMSYIGRHEFFQGHYLYYFGIIGATLLAILALHFTLRKREKLAAERTDDLNSSK